MVVSIYPDQQIPRFFEQSPLTQDDCNRMILDVFIEEFRSKSDQHWYSHMAIYLNGLNILTDADGHITGIVYWDESSWRPFGVELSGLGAFLGDMGSEGYSRVDGHEKLREQFFETMWANMPKELSSTRRELDSATRLAEAVGILYRHLGWVAVGNAMSQHALQYLEGCLGV